MKPVTPEREWVDVIDEHDQVLGRVTRRQMREQNLWHRVASVFCFDSRGRLYAHRRTDDKDVFPGMYDVLASGCVSAGESYAQCARRELGEELGVIGPEPEPLFKHRYEGPTSRSLTTVYRVIWDGAITPQASEIAWGGFCELDELASNRAGWPFVPDGWEILQRYLAAYRR